MKHGRMNCVIGCSRQSSLLVASLLVASGCYRTQETGPVTIMPPIVIEAEIEDDRIVVDALDASALFERALGYMKQGDCERALVDYGRLVDLHEDSRWVDPALFNSGLCYEQLEQNEAAAEAYDTLVERFPSSRNVQDALFRLGHVLEILERWEAVEAVFSRLKDGAWELDAVDTIEVLARRGTAMLAQGKTASARLDLDNAILLYRKDDSIHDGSPDYYYSMAQFQLAEIVHEEMRDIDLPVDDEQLEAVLETKCRLLLDSQNRYTRVIRTGHPHWSGAAAYRTGALYHHLWQDMLAAPLPADLSADASEMYRNVLRKRTRTLLRKAITQWKRTLRFADRLQLDNQWVVSTRGDLARIEAVLEQEEHVAADVPVD